MPLPTAMPSLRARLGELPVDRAPLRRAAVLSVLLVLLLVAGKAFGPSRAAAAAPLDRQDLRAEAEPLSATPGRPGTAWTAGRMAAIGLLVAGVGVALVLRRRRQTSSPTRSRLDVIESRPLGSGHALQLVGCGDEVLLLSVGPDGARLLRSWPRAAVEGEAPAFADLLAEAGGDVAPEPLAASPLPAGEGQGEGANRLEADAGAADAIGLEVTSPTEPHRPPPLSPPVQEGDCVGASVASPTPLPIPPTVPVVGPTLPSTPSGLASAPGRGVLFPVRPAHARGLPQFGGADA